MQEIFQIALHNFLHYSLILAVAYGLYWLIRFAISRLPDGFFGKGREQTWEGVQLLYIVPSSIFGFLMMDYVVISFVTTVIAGGMRDLFRFDFLTAPWGVFTNGMDSMLGLIGCAGIFATTVFGIYEDHPPARLRILGWVAAFSVLVGLGIRLR